MSHARHGSADPPALPLPDSRHRPVVLHVAAPRRSGSRRRRALTAAAEAALLTITLVTVTLAGAWTGWSLLEWPAPPGGARISPSHVGGPPLPVLDNAAPPQQPATGPVPPDPDPLPAVVTDPASPGAGTGQVQEIAAVAPRVAVEASPRAGTGPVNEAVVGTPRAPGPTAAPAGAPAESPPPSSQNAAARTVAASTAAQDAVHRPAHVSTPTVSKTPAQVATPTVSETTASPSASGASEPQDAPDQKESDAGGRRPDVPSRADGASSPCPSEQPGRRITAEDEGGARDPAHPREHEGG